MGHRVGAAHGVDGPREAQCLPILTTQVVSHQCCHLNIVRSDPASDPVYVATEPTQEQRAMLRSLRMKELIDPEEVASRIEPRRTP
jgi:hypothetical protein